MIVGCADEAISDQPTAISILAAWGGGSISPAGFVINSRLCRPESAS